MIPTAAEVEKHWAVEIFAPLQRWDLMESFTKLPAVPCRLCQQREQAYSFLFLCNMVNNPNSKQGKVLKATCCRRNSEGWENSLFVEGKGAGQTFQTLLPSLFGKEAGVCSGERVQWATG